MAERGGDDQIRIGGLMLTCILGVNEVERRERQNVCLDLTLFTDTRAAARADDLATTVDYKRLKLAVKALVENSAFRLLERLAEEVAALCLEEPRVTGVRVCVGKPGALRWARTVEVEIARGRAARQ
jgi:dihydroneopterin aldolase/D-erythro-7,8-dihydroneopterin triphosphate epimerase